MEFPLTHFNIRVRPLGYNLSQCKPLHVTGAIFLIVFVQFVYWFNCCGAVYNFEFISQQNETGNFVN